MSTSSIVPGAIIRDANGRVIGQNDVGGQPIANGAMQAQIDAANAPPVYSINSANILNPARMGQAEQGYNNANFGLDRQSDFMSALRGQAGVQNQSLIFAQQQALANQLQGVANGTGPNPALAQYQQATGQNINAQAALMAGQRGAGANAGLLSRQIGMQGANIQQQAAGQSAILQAQQQLAGMQALQGQQAQLANTSGQMVGNLANANTGYSQAAQSEQQALLNAIGQQNNANVAMQGNINSANARLAEVGMNNSQSNLNTAINAGAGLFGGIGSALIKNGGSTPSSGGSSGMVNTSPGANDGYSLGVPAIGSGYARGGMVANNYACGGMAGYADGGSVDASQPNMGNDGPQSFVGRFLNNSMSPPPLAVDTNVGDNRGVKGPADNGNWYDGIQATGQFVSTIAGLAAKDGGKVPGNAAMPDNNVANDTVPAVLSPGEIVIPRSITTHPNAPAMAAQFVAHVLSRKRPQ